MTQGCGTCTRQLISLAPARRPGLGGPPGREPHQVGVEVDGDLGPARAAVLVLVALPGIVFDLAGEAALHEQHELARGPVDALVQGRVTQSSGAANSEVGTVIVRR